MTPNRILPCQSILRDESVVDDSQAESDTFGDPVEGHGERMSTIQSVRLKSS